MNNSIIIKDLNNMYTIKEEQENLNNSEVTNYIFSVDWFSNNIQIWTRFLNSFKNKPNLHFLEIGCFQGRSTIWLLENILTDKSSKITCIDTFEGSTEHLIYFQNHIKNLFDIFTHNISKFKNKVNIIKDKSQNALKIINDKYDFIYIDGDHKSSSVIEDAILSFSLLKNGGIMIFDDYLWFQMKKHIDTTLICNKGGIDNVGYNIQLPKHKTTKISIISNENKILDVQLFSGNLNDAGILDKQLNMFNNFQPNSNNILLGDSGYDSNNIRNKLKNIKFGKLLTYKNIRNTKNKNKLNNMKLSNKEIKILKNKRIKIEHINAKLKNYKKIIIRYDKKTINYLNTVYLFSILLNLG